MSTEAVGRFRALVNSDEGLQAEIRGMGKVTGDDLVSMAARHGHAFTTQELASVAKELSDQLTPFELEMVTGGVAVDIVHIQAATYIAPVPFESKNPDDTLC